MSSRDLPARLNERLHMHFLKRLLPIVGIAALAVGSAGLSGASATQDQPNQCDTQVEALSSEGGWNECVPTPEVTVVADPCASITVTGLPKAEDEYPEASYGWSPSYTLTIQPGDIVVAEDGTYAFAPGTYSWEFTVSYGRHDKVLQSGFFTVTECPVPPVDPPVVVVNPPGVVVLVPPDINIINVAPAATPVVSQPRTTG